MEPGPSGGMSAQTRDRDTYATLFNEHFEIIAIFSPVRSLRRRMQARERDLSGTEAATATESLFRSAVSTLTAKSLAIVGASERARWPSEIFKNLRQFGYPGRIVLVNPRQTEVYGQRCFPSLRDLPEPAEHALVIVPAAAVAGVLTAAEETGVESATVYAS